MSFLKKHRFKIITITLSLLVICIIFFFAFYKNEDKKQENIYYSVTFNTNDETIMANQFILKGEKVVQPEVQQKDGYIFLGWYLDDEQYDFNQPVYKNMKLEGRWKLESENKLDRLDDKEEDMGNVENNPSTENNKQETKPTEVVVTLNKKNLSLVLGQSSTLIAAVSTGDKKISWKSSDSNVVSVNDGKVIAVGVGNAIVTVSVGGKSASCDITVNKNNKKDDYDYVMKEIKGNANGQYYLYIRDSSGKNVSGKVKIVYKNGSSKDMHVPEGGLIVLKDTIAFVDIIKIY